MSRLRVEANVENVLPKGKRNEERIKTEVY
jgi:hypothetical protein